MRTETITQILVVWLLCGFIFLSYIIYDFKQSINQTIIEKLKVEYIPLTTKDFSKPIQFFGEKESTKDGKH